MKYFKIQELVPPTVYEIRGEKAIQLFDVNALQFLEWCRERYGSCIVNDWSWGGNFSQSGLRTMEFYGSWENYNKSFSQHKYGRAFDMKFKDMAAEEIRQDLKDKWPTLGLDFSITLEDGVSWVHGDTRMQDQPVTSFSP